MGRCNEVMERGLRCVVNHLFILLLTNLLFLQTVVFPRTFHDNDNMAVKLNEMHALLKPTPTTTFCILRKAGLPVGFGGEILNLMNFYA